jgi:anti-anti-sigma factor
MSQPKHNGMTGPETLGVRLRTHRRTALIELFGELDLATVGQVADTFNHLALDPDGFSHVVLDLRGLTFMDAAGIHELVRQSNDAHQNQRNLAIVRGNASISRLMALAAVDALLVLVESPEDLVPPLATAAPPASRWARQQRIDSAQADGCVTAPTSGGAPLGVLRSANGSSLNLP